jgi:flagellin
LSDVCLSGARTRRLRVSSAWKPVPRQRRCKIDKTPATGWRGAGAAVDRRFVQPRIAVTAPGENCLPPSGNEKMTSILTNTSAMVALDTLRDINSDLEDVQSEISTGKTVSSSKDDASKWAISSLMESDVAAYDSISDGLAQANSTVEVAREAADSVLESLNSIKTKITDSYGTATDLEILQNSINDYVDQIELTVESANFNGTNLLMGDEDIEVLSSITRNGDGTTTTSSISISRHDLTTDATTGGLAGLAEIDITTEEGRDAALQTINELIEYVTDVSADYGADQTRLESQSDFISSLTDALTTGVGSMVDADLEEASARLTALQTQQELAIEALSIANSSPESILALFQ